MTWIQYIKSFIWHLTKKRLNQKKLQMIKKSIWHHSIFCNSYFTNFLRHQGHPLGKESHQQAVAQKSWASWEKSFSSRRKNGLTKISYYLQKAMTKKPAKLARQNALSLLLLISVQLGPTNKIREHLVTFWNQTKLLVTKCAIYCWKQNRTWLEPRVCHKHWKIISMFNPCILKCWLNVMVNTHLTSNTVCEQKITFPNCKDSIQLFSQTLF